MRVISVMLVEEVDDMFETSGHGKWKGYAESTLRKRGHIDSAKMLIDTGRLAASITGAYTQDEAEAFTNVEYAKYHVSDAPRTKLPKRDFFDIDIDQVQREAADFLLKELTK
jgi:phage gpG-like protein